jgi:hypothetical protein
LGYLFCRGRPDDTVGPVVVGGGIIRIGDAVYQFICIVLRAGYLNQIFLDSFLHEKPPVGSALVFSLPRDQGKLWLIQ